MKADSFDNKNSYFEIIGNLDVEVDHVNVEGTTLEIDLQALQTTHHTRRYCKRRVLGVCVSRRTAHWQTYQTFESIENGDSLASAVLVGGDLRGQGDDAFVVYVTDNQ